MKLMTFLILVTFLFPALGIAAGQDKFVFQFGLDGYKGTMDTHVTQRFRNSANNMGANAENECCEYDPTNLDGKSVLVMFDIWSLPTNALVSKATLEMYLTRTRNGAYAKEVAAHQLLKSWAEGDGVGIDGRAAGPGEVCGEWTGTGNVWAGIGADRPGKDFVEKANNTIEIADDIGWYEWDVTKMAQYWVAHPDKNFGAILRESHPHARTTGTKVFASKENSDAKIHPRLTVFVRAYDIVGGKTTTTWGYVKQ